jgi:uncharacterized protein YndB with AHSA1/START domain
MAEPQDLTADDYARRIDVRAPVEDTFDAIATLEGLRGWWTPLATGSTSVGHLLRFEFEGLEEHIVMRVDDADRPRLVRWTCVSHTGHPEWVGTTLSFHLVEHGPGACELSFCHLGLRPELHCYSQCEAGWQHFLLSLAAHAANGDGMPFHDKAARGGGR